MNFLGQEKISRVLTVCVNEAKRVLSFLKGALNKKGFSGSGNSRLAALLSCAAVFLVVLCLSAYYLVFPTGFQKTAPYIDVVVPNGVTARDVATLTRKSGIDLSPTAFLIAMRLFGNANGIHSGRYRFEDGVTLAEIVDIYSTGRVAVGTLRIADGMNFKELRALVAQTSDLEQKSAKMTDEELLAAIGATETHPEGLFAPETYHFSPGVTDISIYKIAYERQKGILEKLWEDRAPKLKLKNSYQALILASIIEKETGVHTDRYLVSSVFHNRLKIWMPLQTDPTVIYAMGDEYKGKIHKRDLQRKSPYNTYINYGLPPTPIAMPTTASIKAALHPAKSNYLYFVARGDGTTKFSNGVAEHNVAVEKYQKKKKFK